MATHSLFVVAIAVVAVKNVSAKISCDNTFWAEQGTKCPEYKKEDAKQPYDKAAFKKEVCGPSDCKTFHDKALVDCKDTANPGLKGWISGFPIQQQRECSQNQGNQNQGNAAQKCGNYWSQHPATCPETNKLATGKTPGQDAFKKEICDAGACRTLHDSILTDCKDVTTLKQFIDTAKKERGSKCGVSGTQRGATGLSCGIAVIQVITMFAISRVQ